MRESFLYYLWQFQYFDKLNLATAEGEPVEVFNPGYRNTHSGPDFFNARVRIGGMEWNGSVEIHVNAYDWIVHRHDHDTAYENVVLHVVWTNDHPVRRSDGTLLPVLELQHRVSNDMIFSYQSLLNSPEEIPCSTSIRTVPVVQRLSMFDKVLVQRLQAKATTMLDVLNRNHNDWEETCYQLLCRNFGFKVNADPFAQLGRALPNKLLMKHADQLLQVEALLLGQAGFLDDHEGDAYYALLRREYSLLSQKYSLQQTRLDKAQWRFLRLRPANFPTIRLAQLAAVLCHQRHLFARLMETRSVAVLKSIFQVRQSEYWTRHYQFARPSKGAVPELGDSSIENIIINTVAPLLVAYGKSKDDQQYIDTAIGLLQETPAEQNGITKKWEALGIKTRTAFDSQALLELYSGYCVRHRCLECAIGGSLVRPELK